MAAKKTAKTSPESAAKDAEVTPKPVAKKAAKKAVAKNAAPAGKKAAAKPSLDAIARAAYLNHCRRRELGLPGDHQSDWLEAEQQLAQPE